jgi:hypothetical protein
MRDKGVYKTEPQGPVWRERERERERENAAWLLASEW